jgi:uncharacterized protein (TIGR03083 family)
MSSLRDLVVVWSSACADFSALAKKLDDLEWSLPTDCPGWSVQDIVAHAAALEAELAGDTAPPAVDESAAQISAAHVEAAHIKNGRGAYTESGVLARRDRTPAQLIAEFDDAVERRTAQLAAEPLDDPDATPPLTPGHAPWSWATLLRNRPVDIWVHEQDIRRAVGRPGGVDGAAARHTQETFGAALPFVVAKRAGVSPGSTVIVDVTGPVSELYVVAVDPRGRGSLVDVEPPEPVARLTMNSETFTILGAGRRDPAALPVKIEGDEDVAHRVMAAMAVTP